MIGFFKLEWLKAYYECFENVEIISFLVKITRILVVALLRIIQLILMTIGVIIVVPFEIVMRINLRIIKQIEGKDLSLFFDDSGEE